ncbi:MAG TPA: serine hydrolase [Bacteroidales bacterium]|nr:serine hydrolase [Bacteroidales bacterium]
MKKYLTITATALFIIVAVLSCNSNKALSPGTRLITSVDSILQSQVDSNLIPGAVIIIKQGNNIIYKNAWGFAQKYDYNHKLLDPPEKMTVDHLFDLASLTKVVGTTTSIMLLTDRGLVSPDDPVAKYIPAFNTPEKKSVTLRNLLTHTAGLTEWYPLFYRSSNRKDTYKVIGDLPLKYPVGERRSYSDLGFMLLGEIIEKVSGMPLDQFEEENIFKPLGMDSTVFNPLQSGRFSRIAATSHGNPYEHRMVTDSTLGYTVKGLDPGSWSGWRKYTLRGEVNDGNTWYANGGISGAAGLFSTAGDLQKLVDMLKHKGKVNNKQFISEKTINTFLTPDKFHNGLGWMMDPDDSFMKKGPAGTFGHTGFTGTSICVIPEYNMSIILLINRQNIGLLKSGTYYNVNPIRRQVFGAVMKYCRSTEGK